DPAGAREGRSTSLDGIEQRARPTGAGGGLDVETGEVDPVRGCGRNRLDGAEPAAVVGQEGKARSDGSDTSGAVAGREGQLGLCGVVLDPDGQGCPWQHARYTSEDVSGGTEIAPEHEPPRGHEARGVTRVVAQGGPGLVTGSRHRKGLPSTTACRGAVRSHGQTRGLDELRLELQHAGECGHRPLAGALEPAPGPCGLDAGFVEAVETEQCACPEPLGLRVLEPERCPGKPGGSIPEQ